MHMYTTLASAVDSTAQAQSIWEHVVAYFEARSEALIPVVVILASALVLNLVQAFVLHRWSNRMKFKGFRWTGGVARCLSAPLGWTIWILAITIALQVFWSRIHRSVSIRPWSIALRRFESVSFCSSAGGSWPG